MMSRWTHTLKAFGVENFVLVDVDKTNPFINDSEIHSMVVGSLEEAVAMFPDLDHVYVEEGGTQLSVFHHPENAVYIFGSDYGELHLRTVGIPTAIPLHADIACGIVLNDRSNRWL